MTSLDPGADPRLVGFGACDLRAASGLVKWLWSPRATWTRLAARDLKPFSFPSLEHRSLHCLCLAAMDRIEQAEDTTGSGASPTPQPPQEAFPFPSLQEESASQQQQPASSTRARPARQRPRQPSIRLRRLSSLSSIDQQAAIDNAQAAAPTALAGSTAEDPLPATQNVDDDAWQASRRRSNSEPRPGRYSASPLVTSPAVRTRSSQQHMSPVKEETGRPSIDFNTAERLAPQSGVSLPPPEDGSAEELQRLGTTQSRTRMLRRASNAALSAFGRNRASTVSGPDLSRRSLARDEYDSRIVDLLDVIGKWDRMSCLLFQWLT